MDDLFRLPSARRRDPDVDAWFAKPDDKLRRVALQWFDRMRACGEDVVEVLHDGHPTACVQGVAFGYVNAFSRHINVGFFQGAALSDPEALLQGSGRRMRHVKVFWGRPIDTVALTALIAEAYTDIRGRLEPDG